MKKTLFTLTFSLFTVIETLPLVFITGRSGKENDTVNIHRTTNNLNLLYTENRRTKLVANSSYHLSFIAGDKRVDDTITFTNSPTISILDEFVIILYQEHFSIYNLQP